jgi:hypothetical protein
MKNLVKEIRPRNTYELLVQSEEKKRNFFESVAYLLLIVATSASIWQFSHQPVTFPSIGLAVSKTAVAQETSVRG